MKKKEAKLLNGLALAYIGDGVYELAIREYLIKEGQTRPNQLHHMTTQYVSAKAQARIMSYFLKEEILTGEENNYYKRGRNSKINTRAKNTDIHTYLQATGFESLIGYLYLTKQEKRLSELIERCIQFIENEGEKHNG